MKSRGGPLPKVSRRWCSVANYALPPVARLRVLDARLHDGNILSPPPLSTSHRSLPIRRVEDTKFLVTCRCDTCNGATPVASDSEGVAGVAPSYATPNVAEMRGVAGVAGRIEEEFSSAQPSWV